MSKDIESGTSKNNIQLSIQSPKGFVLPTGCYWDPSVGSGVKNGMVQVLTDDGMLFAQLSYKKDKLDGECLFYDEGQISEKVNYQNDMKHGWSTTYENSKESVSYLYDMGVQKKKLMKYPGEDLWKEVDINNELNYEICKLDKQLKRQGMCRKYVGGVLVEESLYKDGEFAQKCKEFHDKEMTEFDENGAKLYQGEYLEVVLKGNVRNGKGKEFVNGVVSYVGEWKRGNKEGEGKSMKNNRAYYVGQWKDGLPDGKGKLLNEDGSVFLEGEWKGGIVKKGMKYYNYEMGKTQFLLPLWLLQFLLVIVQLVCGIVFKSERGSSYEIRAGYEQFCIWSFVFCGIYFLNIFSSCVSVGDRKCMSAFFFGFSSIGCIASVSYFLIICCRFWYAVYHTPGWFFLLLSPLVFFITSYNIFKLENPYFKFRIPSKWFYGNVCITIILIIDLFYECVANKDDIALCHAITITLDLVVLFLQSIPEKLTTALAIVLPIYGGINIISIYIDDGQFFWAVIPILFILFSFFTFKSQKHSLQIAK